jgi:hypothetical protein
VSEFAKGDYVKIEYPLARTIQSAEGTLQADIDGSLYLIAGERWVSIFRDSDGYMGNGVVIVAHTKA